MEQSYDPATLNKLLDTARKAATAMQDFSASQVERIVHAVANAALDKAEFYADWAVRESGYGRVESKILKNRSNAQPFQSLYGSRKRLFSMSGADIVLSLKT